MTGLNRVEIQPGFVVEPHGRTLSSGGMVRNHVRPAATLRQAAGHGTGDLLHARPRPVAAQHPGHGLIAIARGDELAVVVTGSLVKHATLSAEHALGPDRQDEGVHTQRFRLVDNVIYENGRAAWRGR